MSQSPPPDSSKPKAKKPFVFKKPNLTAKPPTADTDDLSFFSHSQKQSLAALKAQEKRLRDRKKALKKPPLRKPKASDDDEGEDEGNEIRRMTAHRNALRKRYQDISDSEPSDTDQPSLKRSRETSLTPPPQLYSDLPIRLPARTPAAPTISLESDLDPELITISSPTDVSPEPQEDEFLAILANRARARVAARATAVAPPPHSEPLIMIFITSPLPDIVPLIIYGRISQKVKEVREMFCCYQGFTDEQTEDIFLLWKGVKVYDYNSFSGLGVEVDTMGKSMWQEGLSNSNVHVHFEAVTSEILMQWEREQSGEAEEEEEEEEEEGPVIRLVLRGKSIDALSIRVRPNTKIAKIISTFRMARNIGDDMNVSLSFDGDELDPEFTVGDTELEDMFTIDARLH